VIRNSGGGYFGDQTALREVLYNSNIKVATLPPEYNCRTNHLVFINLKAKIIHGVYPDLQSIEKVINQELGNRVFLPELGMIHEGKQTPIRLTKWYFKESFRKFKKKKLVRKLLNITRFLRDKKV